MQIHVTSLQAAPITCVDNTIEHVISFVDPGQKRLYYPKVKKHNHLTLKLHDIPEKRNGLVSPSREHIMDMMDFMLRHDWRQDILIHCLMGVSRSTAAAYIMLNLHNEGRELEIAQYLQAKIPHANPNKKLVEHADQILGREGRMLAAILSLPKPNMATAGTPMILSTEFV